MPSHTLVYVRAPHQSAYKTLSVCGMDGHVCVFLTQSEGGEVPHKVDSGLSPPGHQPQGQVVSCGQHRPGRALSTKRRPEGR